MKTTAQTPNNKAGDSLHGTINPDERILRLSDVIRITSMSKSQIYKLVSEDRFPQPLKLSAGGRSSGWLHSEIRHFIAERIAESRRVRT